MRPKIVGAAWENGFRGTPWRGPLRQLVIVLLLVTGCGIRPTDPIPGLEAPAGPVENTSPALYWVSDGKVIPVNRPQGSVSGLDVVALLAQGPTNAE